MLDGPHHDVPVDNQLPIVVSSGILRNEPRYLRTRNAREVDDLLSTSSHFLGSYPFRSSAFMSNTRVCLSIGVHILLTRVVT
jgi:hypothetical protein